MISWFILEQQKDKNARLHTQHCALKGNIKNARAQFDKNVRL